MRQAFLFSGLALLLSTAACSSNADDPSATDDPIGEGSGGAAGTGGTPGSGGGAVDGDEYAPGIADPCRTHPLSTDFKNDDLCLEPPPEDMGLQIHYGPDFGADYDDPAVLEPYYLAPGAGDKVKCLFTETSNDEMKYSGEYHTRARAGTHHVIMWMGVTEDAARRPNGTFAPECRGLAGQTFFPGTQAGIGDKGARLDVPVGGKEAPENEGYARRILPHAPVSIETHYVNVTEEAMLAEVWMNMIYMPEKDVKVLTDPIFLIGGINAAVAYGQTQITGMDKVPPPPASDGSEEVRIMGFAAHAHAHTHRVTAWINRAGAADREYVYETYDWSEPLNAQFDTVHANPPVNGMGAGKEAAVSGILTMAKGDTFGWECEVENDDLPNVTLTFGDGAYDKEMCNIFGFYAPGNGTGLWTAPFNLMYSR